MKHRFYTRAVSLYLIFGLLLTGFTLPVFAVPASDTNDSSNTPIASDELLVPNEIVPQAYNSATTAENKDLEYIEPTQTAVLNAFTGPIRLNYISTSVQEGRTHLLTATTEPANQTVTWSTSNSDIATVSSTGLVSGIKAGTVTITATMVDADGITQTASCTVYVYIDNGVYYIQNLLSAYHLTVHPGNVTGLPNVYQYVLNPATPNIYPRLTQMWRIHYLSEGRYSIRPMSKLDMALDVTSGNVDVYNVGTADTLTETPTCALWSIEWNSMGYVFKNNGSDNLVIQVEDALTFSGANVIAGTTYDSDFSSCWYLDKIANPPTGTILYDTSANTFASDPIEYVAPEETRSLSNFGLAPTFYSGSSILQNFIWESSNTAIATVDSSTGAVTGVSAGTVTITGRKYYSGQHYPVSYTLVVTEIPEGTYFLKNKQTGYYADIQNQTMAIGTTIQQWEFTGGDSQRWVFVHLGDGYYAIKSSNSNIAHFMGVINDSTSLDVDIVLRTGTVTDGMKWKVELTDNGAYKIIPKTGEASGYVLATSTSSASNGYKLIQGDYIDNNSYRDEWLLLRSQYTATVYNFYDKGYFVNYGETESTSISKINSYMLAVSERYLELFGLEITSPTATYYESAIDTCKSTVNSSNVHTLCSHSNPHTILFDTTNSVSSHFNSNTSPSGSNVVTKAYWSGHRIQTFADKDEYNRCYSSGTSIFMVKLSSSLVRNRNSKGILMHELNHQYGAPDHYHEILNKGTPSEYCRGGDLCSTCGSNPRPASCIMNKSSIDITASTVICSACKTNIYSHLELHH